MLQRLQGKKRIHNDHSITPTPADIKHGNRELAESSAPTKERSGYIWQEVMGEQIWTDLGKTVAGEIQRDLDIVAAGYWKSTGGGLSYPA